MPTLTFEPSELIAGDTLAIELILSDHPAPTWTLTYYLRASGLPTIEYTSTASGTSHSVIVPSATTENWAAGIYNWTCRAWKADSTKETVRCGIITIKPNPAAAMDHEPMSWARQGLALAKAALKELADKPEAQITFPDGRSVTYRNSGEVWALLKKFQAEIDSEDQAELIAKGLSPRSKIMVRFSNPT
jgi:hypothetical protein